MVGRLKNLLSISIGDIRNQNYVSFLTLVYSSSEKSKMDLEKVKLSELRILVAVIQAGSMKSAAALVGRTQPAISQAIANLEATIGDALFERTSTGVVPTRTAEILARRSINAVEELKTGFNEIADQSGDNSGSVSAAFIHFNGYGYPTDALLSFTKKYPRIVLNISAYGSGKAALKAMESRRYNFIFGRLHNAENFKHNSIAISTLLPGELVFATSPTSPWASRKHIHLKELMNEHWIMRGHGDLMEEPLLDAFRSNGLRIPKLRTNTTAIALIRRLVHENNSIIAVPDATLRSLGFAKLNVDHRTIPMPLVVFSNKSEVYSKAAKMFHDHMVSEIARAHASQRPPSDCGHSHYRRSKNFSWDLI